MYSNEEGKAVITSSGVPNRQWLYGLYPYGTKAAPVEEPVAISEDELSDEEED